MESKRDPEREAKILSVIATEALSLMSACAGTGITSRTFNRYREQDADLNERYEQACEQRQAILERRLLTTDDPTQGRVLMHRVGNLDRPEWGVETTLIHDGKLTLAQAFAAAKKADP